MHGWMAGRMHELPQRSGRSPGRGPPLVNDKDLGCWTIWWDYAFVSFSTFIHLLRQVLAAAWGILHCLVPWRREWLPTPVFLPSRGLDRGPWWAIIHGIATTKRTVCHFLCLSVSAGRGHGGRDGSCLSEKASDTLPTPWSWSSRPPTLWEIISCCFGHSSMGFSYRGPNRPSVVNKIKKPANSIVLS